MTLLAVLLAAVGYALMYLTANLARGWLTMHTPLKPPALLLDSFLPWGRALPDHLAWFIVVISYKQERGRRQEPVLLAYLFWLGCAMVVGGFALFLRR